MTGNMKIGAALVGGYLLGRTKKAKMAIGFGMFLVGKKFSFDPKQLGKLVADSPALGTLNEQVRKELVEATKSAATNALTQRAAGLADSLHRRTLELEDPDGSQTRAEENESDDREQNRDGEPDERDAHAEDEEREAKPAPRRKSAAKAPAKSTARSNGRSTSGARRSASGDARGKTTSGARKTASGARETAASAAGEKRGGRNG